MIQFRWFYPGLHVKRWMFMFSIGLLLLILGGTMMVNYQIFGFLEEWLFRMAYALTGSYNYTLLAVSGMVLVCLGVVIMLIAVRKLVKRFLELVAPDQSQVSQQVLNRMMLARGPVLTAVGGGHGLSALLRGMKNKTSNLSAIVTVADDGGSSGRLREEMNIIAPGDLRNCLVAMADKESVLEKLFQYRFGGKGELAGHSLGNLFLAALMEQFGDAERALEAASKVLNVRGQVIPSTVDTVRLSALMADGKTIEGETEIAAYPSRIVHLSTIPAAPRAVPDAVEAIRRADIITLGPGSLYTSILPNLLVPDVLQAIRESSASCLYICNVMTQPGETDGYTVSDHVKALIDHVGPGVINFVLANDGMPAPDILRRYAAVGSYPVVIDPENIQKQGVALIRADLIGETAAAAHNPVVLADEIIRIRNILRSNIDPNVLYEYLGRQK
ncbi:MAG TPA: hypothetical protein DCS74_01475 [Veillonellaceae bacterium]|jgi:uncharacterized cofD-like protein|nr:hypothetical protein [Veillonellaceae bacterium]